MGIEHVVHILIEGDSVLCFCMICVRSIRGTLLGLFRLAMIEIEMTSAFPFMRSVERFRANVSHPTKKVLFLWDLREEAESPSKVTM